VNNLRILDFRKRRHVGIALIIVIALTFGLTSAFAATQREFDSPQAAADALAKAIKANNEADLRAIFGPDSGKLLSSGDKVADADSRAAFAKSYDEANRLEAVNDKEQTLIVGKEEWPMPIPLIKVGAHWSFDTKKGADEILARRIGRNELSAMKVLLAIVDAERDYSTHDLDKDGLPEYAAHFVSSPGKRDGLYWPTSGTEAKSPLGTLLAAAADEGYARPGSSTLEPYHGYYYRILLRQGKNAPGGAQDYEVKGKLMAGFALLAYPARYGSSGVMTFIVSHDGVVYEKNLGPHTKTASAAITAFDPDTSWKKSELPK
jgi:hypothetical protein